MKPRGRRWRSILVGIAIAAVVLFFVTPPLLRRIVRQRLQELVSDRLNARLEIGDLIYHYPYGVDLSDATLVTQTPDGQPLTLLEIPRLRLALAKLPFGNGPLVIQRLEIAYPSIHLIRTADGLVGSKALVRQSPPAESGPPTKLSDILQLTEFVVHGGSIVYEDTTAPGTVPVVWKNLNVDLTIKPESSANYAYQLRVNNAPLATLDARGTANLDDLTLQLEQCALAVTVDPDATESPLPAAIQRPLQDWRARGKIAINLSADVALRHPADGIYHCAVDLTDASARVPGWQTPLDKLLLKIELAHGSESSVSAHVDVLQADAQGARVRLNDAVATVDPVSGAWKLKLANGHLDAPSNLSTLPPDVRDAIDKLHVTGSLDLALNASGPSFGTDLTRCTAALVLHPQNLTFRPPGFSEPIGGMVDTTLSLADGSVLMQELRAASGDNLLYIQQARIQLADLPKAVRVTDAAGCLTLGPSHTYPPLIANDLAPVQPAGPYFFGGDVAVDLSQPQPALDYHLNVHTNRGRITLGPSGVPLTDIDTMISITPAGATVEKLNGSLLDGSCSASGNVKFTDAVPYAVKLDCRDLDLKELAGYLSQPGDQPTRLSGRGMLIADLTGVIPPAGTPAYQGIRGTGEFEIRHGDFWEIPVMKSIARAFSKDSLIVGEAAGQFQLGDGKVHFNRAVANSPLLGVEGSGDVGYDGTLNFKGVADPFGSWGDRVGAPGPLANFLGTVQRTINIATSTALYQIVVTGTTSVPKTTTVPAPIVTHGVQSLLSKARDQNLVGGLLDELHKHTDNMDQ
jgi:uncharacterized protein involved in outer membrane biogenesis